MGKGSFLAVTVVSGLVLGAIGLVGVAGASQWRNSSMSGRWEPTGVSDEHRHSAEQDTEDSAVSAQLPEVPQPPPMKPELTEQTSPQAPAITSPSSPTGDCYETGPNQLLVERYLADHPEFGPVTVDGVQSPQDCETIKAFQRRYETGAPGVAGPITGELVQRLSSAALGSCDGSANLTVCVDLTSQTMWVVRAGAIVLGPTTVRTGRAGLATPAGRFRITEKLAMTRSSYFDVDLPYWQRFYADMGFHTTTSYLYEGPGSHGCINVLAADSDKLFSMTTVGTSVHIFGRKLGT